MKRVLIISYYWPPSGGSGVQRWVKFAKYLPQNGWQPVIYTPENPELTTIDKSLENDIPQEAEILRRPIFEPYGIYRKLSGIFSRKGKNSGDGSKEENPINAQKKSLGQKISLWIRGNFFIPDPRCFWVRPSVKYLKDYLKEHPVDVMVSTGPPHSMHLIASKLSAETGIPWVADFRDPWTKMFYFKHLELSRWACRKHESLEKQVLDNATVVVAVSPLVQQEFREMTKTPVELITNGFDEDDFDAARKELSFGDEGKEGLFSIVHTGLFASDGNPLTLWKVLSELASEDRLFAERLRIRLVGKTDRQIVDAISEAGLIKNTDNLGYVSHKEAVREQCSASMLILPLRQEPELKATLPGKVFEYLASRRPVLGIGHTDGAMANLLTEAKAGITCDWDDKEDMKREILRCWNLFREGKLADNEEDISKYSRRGLSLRMASLFDALLQDNGPDRRTPLSKIAGQS